MSLVLRPYSLIRVGAIARPIPVAGALRSPMRVLIVEDEPIIAMELESIVLDCIPTAEIVLASSISQAKAAIHGALDVAFLDIDVTDGKTYEIARALKTLGVPFVFVSAASVTDAPTELAAESFIPKPFASAEITGTLDGLAKKEADEV